MKTLLALTVILGGVLFTQNSYAYVSGDPSVRVATFAETNATKGRCTKLDNGGTPWDKDVQASVTHKNLVGSKSKR